MTNSPSCKCGRIRRAQVAWRVGYYQFRPRLALIIIPLSPDSSFSSIFFTTYMRTMLAFARKLTKVKRSFIHPDIQQSGHPKYMMEFIK